MIINIAGTNGSGKSTVVRNLMNHCKLQETVLTEGREHPLGYVVRLAECRRPIYIVGAYVYGTGGADTIKRLGVEPIFQLVEDKARDYHVVYEGAFVMNHTRGPALVSKLDTEFYVLLLTTPLEVCFQEINKRRDSTEFKSPALQRKNIEGNHVRAQNYAAKMKAAGAYVHRVTRDNALDDVLALLQERAAVSD